MVPGLESCIMLLLSLFPYISLPDLSACPSLLSFSLFVCSDCTNLYASYLFCLSSCSSPCSYLIILLVCMPIPFLLIVLLCPCSCTSSLLLDFSGCIYGVPSFLPSVHSLLVAIFSSIVPCYILVVAENYYIVSFLSPFFPDLLLFPSFVLSLFLFPALLHRLSRSVHGRMLCVLLQASAGVQYPGNQGQHTSRAASVSESYE